MTIKGYLERVLPKGVGGWCVDERDGAPATVEIRVNATVLATVRADIPRADIERALNRHLTSFWLPFSSKLFKLLPRGGKAQASVNGQASGFWLPFSPQLFKLLPHGGEVQASVNGQVLSVWDQCTPRIDNPGGTGEELMEMLDNGYLVSAKSGHIDLPLSHGGRGEKALTALEECDEIFFAITSEHLFICYGTLLGHVREGGFIPHDDDVDVCFLAKATGLEAAVAEFRQLVSTLRAQGEHVSVKSGAQFHWFRAGKSVDVFMAWMEDDHHLYMYNAGGRFSRDRISPLRRGELEGHSVFVPNDAEGLLELIYGAGWRTPDPSFQWRLTPEVTAKMRELRQQPLTDVATHEGARQYWKNFYRQQRTIIPTPFAASVANELDGQTCGIIDVGCGNGRDSHFFAGLGHHVLGLDAVQSMTVKKSSFIKKRRRNLTFAEADAATPNTLRQMIDSMTDQPLVIYARFFFHAISEDEETYILDVLTKHLPVGARCYFEFRTSRDAETPKRFDGHYRRFIDLDRFVTKMENGGEMQCVYRIEGQGMAKFGSEDPFVGRVHCIRQ